MDETRYGLRVSLDVPYEEAVSQATDVLKSQGFGVLTTIDVKQTLKNKLNRDFRKYVIMGACNPQLADRALHSELEVGLLLPCNVIVYETRRWASSAKISSSRAWPAKPTSGCGMHSLRSRSRMQSSRRRSSSYVWYLPILFSSQPH
jgi:uncharacterized protein (DUF302 family)